MALPQGINFRETSGYVTDTSPATFQIDINNPGDYPVTTPQGNNVGYESLGFAEVNARNRSTTIDARLAGFHFLQSALLGSAIRYRIDLASAGEHNIRVAAGDALYAAQTYLELFDTTTSLGVLCSGSTGAGGSFKDATDATYTAANWPASNTAAAKTFSSTICRFKFYDGANQTAWSHVYVESAAAAGDSHNQITLPPMSPPGWPRVG